MNSSWISQVLYKRCLDGKRYLAVFLKRPNIRYSSGVVYSRDPEAHLFENPPYWVRGLLEMYQKNGEKSPGKGYNKLLKGKYRYQRVVGREQVKELKEMMK